MDDIDFSSLIKLIYRYDNCLFYLNHKLILDPQSQTLINQTQQEFQNSLPLLLKYSNPSLLTSLQKERVKLMIDLDIPFDIISKEITSFTTETPTLQKLSNFETITQTKSTPLESHNKQEIPNNKQEIPNNKQEKPNNKQQIPNNKQEIPNNNKQEIPNNNKQEIPTDNKQEIPKESEQEIPKESKQEIPTESNEDFLIKITNDYKELHESFLKNMEEIKPLIKDIGDEVKPYLNNIMKEKLGCDMESFKANSFDKIFSQFFRPKPEN